MYSESNIGLNSKLKCQNLTCLLKSPHFQTYYDKSNWDKEGLKKIPIYQKNHNVRGTGTDLIPNTHFFFVLAYTTALKGS